ncbi:MAG TPA: hypothetical protein VF520_03125 [Thermoleophilaceae bacterium]
MPRRLPACAVAALAASAALAACGGDIRQDELNRSVANLQSLAGDGELLALGAAEDRTKATFVRAHARELSEEADHEAEKLHDASADPSLEDEKRRAVDLADQVSAGLGRLQVAPADRDVARQVRERLRGLADSAEALRDEL